MLKVYIMAIGFFTLWVVGVVAEVPAWYICYLMVSVFTMTLACAKCEINDVLNELAEGDE